MNKKSIIVITEVSVLCFLTLVYLLSPIALNVHLAVGYYFVSYFFDISLTPIVFTILLAFNVGLVLLLFLHPFFKKKNLHLRILLFGFVFLISAAFIYSWVALEILERI
jgi:hypothetical protein